MINYDVEFIKKWNEICEDENMQKFDRLISLSVKESCKKLFELRNRVDKL